ncbi:preprotein translocase subunit SecY [Candidatus Bodocaedibacter vickermanii]|uniref:Protein translocase subunit SecY n=1 Tax=Candidatus Bodocaedibacter vickermanii TaxID=2741701 RepID=A0A7L9RS41_9PROT|nr:Protein translocase subunit SecY [Candidatus Paracaedibacteraceae bacterium 'Lake Konstanz']
MASAAEQLASSFSLKAFSKAEDLKKRIWFTLGALIVYRFGTFIPSPGIDPVAMANLAGKAAGGLLAVFNTFGGGALSRMTIFALSIVPYITASIITQLLTSIVPQLEALKKDGETGRKKINQYTRYLTVIIAIFQASSMAVFLESVGDSPVMESGLLFRVTFITSLVGGTVFLMWLGEQITSRGIGQGSSLIIFAGIISGLPQGLALLFEMGRNRTISPLFVIAVLVLATAIVLFVVFMERSFRKINIQYPKRQVGNKMYGGNSTHLPLKLNSSGVIPPIFAGALLSFPATIAGFSDGSGWLGRFAANFQHGTWGFIILYVSLIVFFAFFYTSVVFNSEETAENLRKGGALVLGIRPGKNTADYLDYILTRLTVAGAAYISLVCVMPEIFTRYSSIPLALGGTGVLIVVSVTIETVGQIHSHMIAQQYEGLMKKSWSKGKGLPKA